MEHQNGQNGDYGPPPPRESRGRSLERFEESLRRLDPPKWMSRNSAATASTVTTDSEASDLSTSSRYTITPTNEQLHLSFSTGAGSGAARSSSSSRPRYADHRRSYSAQRGATAASSSLWRTDPVPPRTPSSRGPSPAPPGSRPATAGGRFHSSSFSRWSASTLCSDSAGGYTSTGENTPTESVVSAFSMRSGCGANADPPMYQPPRLLVNSYHQQTQQHPHYYHGAAFQNRPLGHHQRPYLGWRSQEGGLNDDPRSLKYVNPAERLAYSYRRASRSRSGGDVHSTPFYPPDPLTSCQTLPRGGGGNSHLNNNNCQIAEKFLHDSIRSVSSAIMEFCQAEDVPPPPPPSRAVQRPRTHKTASTGGGHQRAKIVWLESSFVSTASPNKSKL